jgi:hypothetical protein
MNVFLINALGLLLWTMLFSGCKIVIPHPPTFEDLLRKGLPENETKENILYKISVSQILYPSKRINGKEGHFVHLMQFAI